MAAITKTIYAKFVVSPAGTTLARFVNADGSEISDTTAVIADYRGRSIDIQVQVLGSDNAALDLTGLSPTPTTFKLSAKDPADMAGDFLWTATSGGSKDGAEDLSTGLIKFDDVNLNTVEFNTFLGTQVGQGRAYGQDKGFAIEMIDNTGGSEVTIYAQGYSTARRDLHRGTEDAPIYANLVHNTQATRDPLATDDVDSGYGIGSIWINTTDSTLWRCRDASDDAAIWTRVDQDTIVVRLMATGDTTIASALEAGDSIDGVNLAEGDLAWLPSQSTATEDGIYEAVASAAGAASRWAGMPVGMDVAGLLVVVLEGSTNTGLWYIPDSSAVIGSAGHTPVRLVEASEIAGFMSDLVDDTTPQLGGALDTNSFAINHSKGADLASASTVNIGGATDGNQIDITGTTTITAFDTVAAGILRWLTFDGALTLTHHATSLILPTGANITTAAGDTCLMQSLGSGNWQCLAYLRKDGTPVGQVDHGGLAGLADNDHPQYHLQALSYTFSTTTADADPGAGILRFDNATPASVTEIYIDDAPANVSGLDLGTVFDASTNGRILVVQKNDTTKFLLGEITADTDGSGYWKLTVTVEDSGSLPDDAAELAVHLLGGSGVTDHGSLTGLGDDDHPQYANQSLEFTFSTTTTAADPGAGVVRFDNATPASVTELYVDDSPANISGLDLGPVLDDLAGHHLLLTQKNDPSKFLLVTVDTDTDSTGYWTLTVTVEDSGSLPDDGATLSAIITPGPPTAGSGDVSGPASSTDNTFPRFNGTGGKTIQAGQIVETDAGQVRLLKATDEASATTTDLSAIEGNFVHVTGTTTITGLGTVAAGVQVQVVFDGALTLTHHATSLILPTGANITTAAGDAAIFVSEGSGNWRCLHYQRKDGTALAAAGGGTTTMFIPASAFTPRATNGPGVAVEEYATNDVNLEYLLFDGATEEYACALVQLPSTWDLGTITGAHYWDAATGASAADTVEWELAARAYANDDAIDQAAGTGQVISDAVLAVGDMHITSASPAITVAGSPAAGQPILLTVSRNVTGTDDMTEDAKWFGVLLTWTNS